MKKVPMIFLSLSILMFGVITAKGNDITIKVDDNVVKAFDVKAYIDSTTSRTMVPATFVAKSMGCIIDWDSETGVVHIENDFTDVKLKVGSNEVMVKNKVLKIDTEPVINEKELFVPLRFIFEIFSARVEWDKNTKTIEVYSGESEFLDPEISIVYPRNKWEAYEFRVQLDNWRYYLEDNLDYEIKIEFTQYPLNKKEQPEFYGEGWMLIEMDRWRKVDGLNLYELLPYYTTRDDMFELRKGMEFEFIICLRNNKTGEMRKYLDSVVYKDLVEWTK